MKVADTLSTADITTWLSTLTLDKIIPAALALVIGIVAVRLLCRLFEKLLSHSRLENHLLGFVRSLFRIVLYVIVALIVAGTLGFNVSSLVAMLSVVSLALSLAVQGTLSNIAGGIQILSSHPLRVGDYVEISQTEGTVSQIGMIYTSLVTPDHKTVHLPNSDVASSKIINYTVLGTRRIDLSFSAAYSCATQDVREALLLAAKREAILEEPAPLVQVAEYGDSSISYRLRVWCRAEDYWTLYYSITENVRTEFQQAGLEMCYPHLNVHLDVPAT